MNHFRPSGTLQARAFANAGLVPFPALLLFIPWGRGGNTAMPQPRQMLSKEGPKHSARCIVAPYHCSALRFGRKKQTNKKTCFTPQQCPQNSKSKLVLYNALVFVVANHCI